MNAKLPTKVRAKQRVTIKVRNGAIEVEPDELRMGEIVGQEVEWTVVTPGWDFPVFANGIALKANHRDFSNGHRPDKKKFRLTNLNSERRRHRYNVVLVHSSGRELRTDPSIVNRG